MSLNFDYSEIEPAKAYLRIHNLEELQERYGDDYESLDELVEKSASWQSCQWIWARDWDTDGSPELDYIEQMNPTMHSLIWITMAIGMRQITSRNAEKFFARCFIYEEAYEPFRWQVKDGKRVPIRFTRQEVEDFIGLTTNASVWTDAKFKKQMSDVLYQNVDALAQEACEEAAESVEA